jgi:hypothetical protein
MAERAASAVRRSVARVRVVASEMITDLDRPPSAPGRGHPAERQNGRSDIPVGASHEVRFPFPHVVVSSTTRGFDNRAEGYLDPN